MARDPESAVHLPPPAQPAAPVAAEVNAAQPAAAQLDSTNVHNIEDPLTACLPSDPLSQGAGKWRCRACSSGPGFRGLKTLADCYAHGKSKRDSQHDRLVELLEGKYGKSKCMPVSQQQAHKSRSIVAAYDPKTEGAAHILFPPTLRLDGLYMFTPRDVREVNRNQLEEWLDRRKKAMGITDPDVIFSCAIDWSGGAYRDRAYVKVSHSTSKVVAVEAVELLRHWLYTESQQLRHGCHVSRPGPEAMETINNVKKNFCGVLPVLEVEKERQEQRHRVQTLAEGEGQLELEKQVLQTEATRLEQAQLNLCKQQELAAQGMQDAEVQTGKLRKDLAEAERIERELRQKQQQLQQQQSEQEAQISTLQDQNAHASKAAADNQLREDLLTAKMIEALQQEKQRWKSDQERREAQLEQDQKAVVERLLKDTEAARHKETEAQKRVERLKISIEGQVKRLEEVSAQTQAQKDEAKRKMEGMRADLVSATSEQKKAEERSQTAELKSKEVQDEVELLHDQLDPTMRQLHDLKKETNDLWRVLRRICSDKLLGLERDCDDLESTKPIAVKSLGAPSRTLLVDRFKMDPMLFFRLSGQLENEERTDVPEGEKLAETFKVKIVDGDVAGYEVKPGSKLASRVLQMADGEKVLEHLAQCYEEGMGQSSAGTFVRVPWNVQQNRKMTSAEVLECAEKDISTRLTQDLQQKKKPKRKRGDARD